MKLQNADGTELTDPSSECKGDNCTCVNILDDLVQKDVVKGDVRLVGIFETREAVCRYNKGLIMN